MYTIHIEKMLPFGSGVGTGGVDGGGSVTSGTGAGAAGSTGGGRGGAAQPPA